MKMKAPFQSKLKAKSNEKIQSGNNSFSTFFFLVKFLKYILNDWIYKYKCKPAINSVVF